MREDTNYKVEKLEESQYDQLKEIYEKHQQYHKDLEGYPYPNRFIVDISVFKNTMKIAGNTKKATCYIVRDENGKIISFLGATINNKNRMSIEDFTVLKEYRGQGIGNRLLETCFEEARDNGIVNSDVHTSIGNERALHIYKRFGYQVTGYSYKRIQEPESKEYLESENVRCLSRNEIEKLREIWNLEKENLIEDSEHPYKNKLKMNDFENFMVDVNMNDMDIKFIEEEKIVGYIAYKINKNQLCVYQLYSPKKQTELVLLQDIMKEGESKGTSVMSIDVVIGDNTKKEVVEKLGFQCTGYNQSIESNERTKELGNR